ncbi:MAG: TIGR04222 domain-containing membrane protein, partial [Sphingopyxis sp.]|nr:TIGR04222 domain-containing membrane protein [Sphingopyxis sp.]
KGSVPAVKPGGRGVERRLAAGGLLLDADERRRTAMIAVAPFALLLLIGGIKLLVGLSRDKPVSVLVILLVITLMFAIGRWRSTDNQTRAGRMALAEARKKHDRLRRAPTTGETGMAVALFGTTVLAGSAYAAFHQWRAPSNSSGGDSSSSSSDSGCSGGGSSGCGGCGGGGD